MWPLVRFEEVGILPSDRLFSPSAERNKAPISEVLSQVLPGAASSWRSAAALDSTCCSSRERCQI